MTAEAGRAFLNPSAGSCDEPDAWRERLEAAGFEVRLPGSGEEARQMARAAARQGVERVVAAGGDGTVHQVANGLLEAGGPGEAPELAVLPLGTGDDYARSLGLPTDPHEVLDRLAGTPARPVDVIELRPGPTWCLNVAVGGFGGEATDDVDREEKRHLGSLAYLKSAVEELSRLPRFETRLVVDGKKRRDTLVNVVLANGRFTAGGVPVGPKGGIDDGRMRLLLVPAVELAELAKLASGLVAGDRDDRAALLEGVREVEVASEPEMRFRADGEPSTGTPLSAAVRPGALSVVRPEGEDRADG